MGTGASFLGVRKYLECEMLCFMRKIDMMPSRVTGKALYTVVMCKYAEIGRI
jgi:hypothetical protein